VLAPFLVMFREGVEAALIVGIVAAYLRKTGRADRLAAMWIGVGLSAGACLVIGVVIQATRRQFPQKQQEMFAAAVAVVAVVVLTWMVFWMRRVGRSIKGELEARIDTAVTAEGWAAGLVGLSFFAVAREGLESVVFLVATFQQGSGARQPAGALLGVVASVGVGVLLYQGGRRLNLRLFFSWTGAFVIVVAAGLAAGAVRAAHEAGVFNVLQQRAFSLRGAVDDSTIPGTILRGVFGYNDTPTVAEVLVYLGYLVPTVFVFIASSGRSSVPSRPSETVGAAS